jgi:hypothetical protein
LIIPIKVEASPHNQTDSPFIPKIKFETDDVPLLAKKNSLKLQSFNSNRENLFEVAEEKKIKESDSDSVSSLDSDSDSDGEVEEVKPLGYLSDENEQNRTVNRTVRRNT